MVTLKHPVFHVIPSQPEHAEQQASVMLRVYDIPPEESKNPEAQVFSADVFRRQQHIFPQGQFVAVSSGQVIGLTASMLLPFDLKKPFIEPWFTTISDGWLDRHDPASEWMYGVESCVLSPYQSRGVGGALMTARFDVIRDMNLRGIVAGSALISYAENVQRYGDIKPDDYIRRVQAGTLYDINLTKQMKKGFTPVAVIPDYLIGDPTSLGWGAVIVWHNRAYDPTKGRGAAQHRRYTLELKL